MWIKSWQKSWVRYLIDEITKAIAKRIYELFGSEYEVYVDKVEQGLKEPCFYILCVMQDKEIFSQLRHKRRTVFDISYFPKTNQTSELHEASGKLMDGMCYIELTDGNKIRGTEMAIETVDGVLHFQVEYNYIALEDVPKAELMKDIEVNQ